ncbi:DUF2913 family protein (plasmid) [Pantoea ananatis]|nr:DUF2913 family protein [Pantoea ananatis]
MNTGNNSTGHLAWCGLVALQLARRDGPVITPAQESLFLTRWLAVAEKQRRFRKELAGDIRWLLKEGREKGVRADLPGKLDYLWRSGSADLLAQNDLYRLQHALQVVQSAGWVYMLLSDGEWQGRKARRLNAAVTGIYLLRNGLHRGFDPAGQQTKPLPARAGQPAAALGLAAGTGRRRPAAALSGGGGAASWSVRTSCACCGRTRTTASVGTTGASRWAPDAPRAGCWSATTGGSFRMKSCSRR